MKRVLLVLVVLVGLLSTSLQLFASSQVGKVTRILVRASDGLTYFYLDSPRPEGKPECARNNYWMIKDENSEVGKKQYSMLLAARSTGQNITIYGFDTCSRWGDGEDVDSIVF